MSVLVDLKKVTRQAKKIDQRADSLAALSSQREPEDLSPGQ
jgi:hypothetical protein